MRYLLFFFSFLFSHSVFAAASGDWQCGDGWFHANFADGGYSDSLQGACSIYFSRRSNLQSSHSLLGGRYLNNTASCWATRNDSGSAASLNYCSYSGVPDKKIDSLCDDGHRYGDTTCVTPDQYCAEKTGDSFSSGYYLLDSEDSVVNSLTCGDGCQLHFSGTGSSVGFSLDAGVSKHYARGSYEYADVGAACSTSQSDSDLPVLVAVQLSSDSIPAPTCPSGSKIGYINHKPFCFRIDESSGSSDDDSSDVSSSESPPAPVTTDQSSKDVSSSSGGGGLPSAGGGGDSNDDDGPRAPGGGGSLPAPSKAVVKAVAKPDTSNTRNDDSSQPGNSATDADCSTVPACKGDPIACLALANQHRIRCSSQAAREDFQAVFGESENRNYDPAGDSALRSWKAGIEAEYGSFADLEEGGALDTKIDLSDKLNLTQNDLPTECPPDLSFKFLGAPVAISFAKFCDFFRLIGLFVKLSGTFLFFRIVYGAF